VAELLIGVERVLRIRALRAADYSQIKEIHEKYYKEEFDLPDFVKNYVAAFAIEDGNGIVSACGLRTIAEAVAVTDKDRTARTRRSALLIGSEALAYVAGQFGYDQFHVFVQDPIWQSQLMKAGFELTRGDGLVREVNNGQRG
jgi:hypothetical protein